MHNHTYWSFLRLFALAGTLAGFGCAGVKANGSATGTAGSNGSAGSGGGLVTGTGGSGSVMPASCNGPCTDFPPDPINTNIPSVDPAMFGTPSGSGPCVTEPEDGSLFPNNWLRPRVRVPGAAYMKITVHADLEANDLTAYASGETWKMPDNIWKGLASHVVQKLVSVTVQLPSGGATTVRFQIAPVGAGGSLVFWAANPTAANKDPVQALPTDSDLQGFAVGDEKTTEALNTANLKQQVFLQDGSNTHTPVCIGCHTGTPDGNYVAFDDAWPWSAAFAGVKPDISGQALPGYLGYNCTTPGTSSTCSGSKTFVQYPWAGPLAFSPAHWTTGDRIAIVASQLAPSDLTTPWNTDDKLPGNLVWIDTESTQTQQTSLSVPVTPVPGTSFGYLAHTGDLGGASFPNWSADGNTIVYASTVPGTSAQPGDQDGRLNQGTTDLYSIPYASRAGGAATPVPGASSTGLEEYYPALSPDDRLLAFTAVPAGQGMYANKNAELYVVPFGQVDTNPIRLAANAPPSCTNVLSPGVNNHWPKWSPAATVADGKTYYWIVFSSNRYGLPSQNDAKGNTVQISQLYITAVVVDEVGPPVSYPAIYLWNQSQATLNTTPAWQDFHIPIVID